MILPVRLFNTHTDVDHVGSNEEFDEVMMKSPRKIAAVINNARCFQKVREEGHGSILS